MSRGSEPGVLHTILDKGGIAGILLCPCIFLFFQADTECSVLDCPCGVCWQDRVHKDAMDLTCGPMESPVDVAWFDLAADVFGPDASREGHQDFNCGGGLLPCVRGNPRRCGGGVQAARRVV